jgi:hypothetical protein
VVLFDFSAADAAARELELTSQALLAARGVLEQDVPVVADGWEGRFREVFDVESLRHDVAAQALAEDLLALAAMIRASAVEAEAAVLAERRAADDRAARPPGPGPVGSGRPRRDPVGPLGEWPFGAGPGPGGVRATARVGGR